MWMHLSTFQTVSVISPKVIPECLYRTRLFTTNIAIFLSVKENARIKFWFSALLFPEGVFKSLGAKTLPFVFKICTLENAEICSK